MGNKIQKIYIGSQLVWPGWIGDLSKWSISQTSSALSSTWYGGVYFNNDGTKIYLTQYGNSGKIHEGTLSTPYDISTISITNSLSVQYPEDIHFSGDGKKMFIIKSDTSPYRILRYTLSTAWDLSTATQDQYIDRGSSNADRGLYITPDGKNIYIGTRSGSSDGLVKYTLSTAWDLSTAGTVESISNTLGGISIWFGDNGKLLFTSTEGISTIRYYKLSTAYDVSSITEQGTLNIAGVTRAGGMRFNDSGTMGVIVGGGGSTNYVTKYKLVRPNKGPFIYDFTTKTTSDLATDGWTVGTGVGTDSGGFYGGILWYPMSQIGYVDATKKITIIQEFATGTVGSWTDALGLGLNENNINSADDTVGEIYMGLMINTNYKLRWIIYYSGGTVASNNFDWISNTEYSATFIIDLANKSLNFELKLKSNGSTVITVTRALSDTEVSKFIGSPYLCTTNGSRGRIHNIRVIIA